MLIAPQIAEHGDDAFGGPSPHGAVHRDEYASRSDAEECQPDDKVGVVVPELERDDPRVADFEEETCQADEEDCEHARQASFVVGHSAHRQTPLENGGSYRAR